ncbi:MAG: NAD(P)-dependent oxidoreductase [Burkholderiales bacterium]|nr:NAD(P)-dependent oxidoreductase [Burkholderiales bacterium]
MKTGFIGLGRMGAAMAARLCHAGHEVTVYNRSPEKADHLVAMGARRAADIAEACQSGVIFSMLSDDHAVEEIAFGKGGILESLARGAIHVSCSTISVEFSARLAAAHREAGQEYVSLPVFGRPDAAASGKLYLVAGGERQLVEKIRPLLDILGQKTFHVADSPESANLVKLSGNFLIATVIESLGEAFALVEKGGVDRKMYLELLTSSLFDLPVYRNYGRMIADRQFDPAGFAARLGRKDMRLVLSAAEELKVPLPFASILRDRFLELAAHGGDDLDWSSIGSLAAQDAALDS